MAPPRVCSAPHLGYEGGVIPSVMKEMSRNKIMERLGSIVFGPPIMERLGSIVYGSPSVGGEMKICKVFLENNLFFIIVRK